MNTTSPHEILQANCVNSNAYITVEHDPWQKDYILMLDVRSLSEFANITLSFSRNTSKSLNEGDWCSNKSVNQTKVMPNNKAPMSPTWTRLIGYRWRWNQMTKHTWLMKPQNFERALSNLLGRPICGSCGWHYVLEMHPKEVGTWLVYKWTIDSWNVWFSCSRFLRVARTPSMDVNMTMNIMKYDTNKRWVIHNLNQQEVDNLRLFENFSFKEEG
jgi:hypothetical protein